LPPRPNQPKKTRRDLAEQVSIINPMKMGKRGIEAWQWFLKNQKKGMSKQELFDETYNRFSDGTTTGLFQDPAGHVGAEVSDEDLRVKEGVKAYGGTSGGKTPVINAEDLIDWPGMFAREPRLRRVKTQFILPDPANPPDAGGWYMPRFAPHNASGAAQMVSKPGLDINADDMGSLRSITAHELGGHANQDFGGFLSGARPDDPDLYKAHDKLVFPRARMFRDAIESARSGSGLSDADWAKQFREADYYLQGSKHLMGAPGRNPNMSTATPLDRYLNVSGEISADQVDQRKNMTVQERQDDPVWNPMTGGGAMPEELQLLRRGPKTYTMQPDAAAKKKLAEILAKPAVAATAGAGAVAAGSDAEAAPMFQTDYNPFAADPTKAPEDQPTPGKTFMDRVEEARAPKPEPEPQGWMDWIGDNAVSGANVAVDVAKTIPSAVRNAFESAPALGDFAAGKKDLINWINTADGRQWYPQENLDKATDTFTKGLPTSEDIHGTVSSVLPKEVEDITTYEPKTGAGALMQTNIEMGLDPLDLLGGLGVAGKAKKVLALLKAGKIR
jgi:hypothetical protein